MIISPITMAAKNVCEETPKQSTKYFIFVGRKCLRSYEFGEVTDGVGFKRLGYKWMESQEALETIGAHMPIKVLFWARCAQKYMHPNAYKESHEVPQAIHGVGNNNDKKPR